MIPAACPVSGIGIALLAGLAWLGAAGADRAKGGAEWSVVSSSDAADLEPGDGICASALPGSPCTLRAAVQEANASPGADSIVLPAGTYALTLDGLDEELAATGDLDFSESVAILGSGEAATFIDGGAPFTPTPRPTSFSRTALFPETAPSSVARSSTTAARPSPSGTPRSPATAPTSAAESAKFTSRPTSSSSGTRSSRATAPPAGGQTATWHFIRTAAA